MSATSPLQWYVVLLVCVASDSTDADAQNDFPQLKYALLGGLGLLALIQRE